MLKSFALISILMTGAAHAAIVAPAPEMDPGTAISALALLLGCLMILRNSQRLNRGT